MNRPSIRRKLYGVFAILFIVIFLASCGKKPAANVDPSSAPAESAPAASANTQKEKDTGKKATAAGWTGKGGYDNNGIKIEVGDVDIQDTYFMINIDITNNMSRNPFIDFYPIIINDSLVIDDGYFDTVGAGELLHAYVMFNSDAFGMVGLTSVNSVQAFMSVQDAKSYDTISGPEVVTFLTGDAGSGGEIRHSDQIIYDNNDVRISYLGSYDSEYYGKRPAFLVSNDGDSAVNVGSPYMEELIDGEPADEKYLSFAGTSLPAHYKSLIFAEVLNSDTYDAEPYDTLDFEIKVSSETGDWYSQMVPVHLKAEGKAITLSAEEAYYPDYVLEHMEYDKKEAEQKAHDDALQANAEKVQDPVIVQTGIYNYTIGTSYNKVSVTAMVRNPNERTYIYNVKIEGEAYGADGALLGTMQPYYVDKFTIAPGATLPFEMSTRDKIDLGVDVTEVKLKITGYSSFNELDLEKEIENRGLFLETDAIQLEDIKVYQGNSEGTALERYEAYYTMTLKNDEKDSKKVYIMPVLYDANDEVILSSCYIVEDLASGEVRDIKFHFDTAIYDISGAAVIEIFVLR